MKHSLQLLAFLTCTLCTSCLLEKSNKNTRTAISKVIQYDTDLEVDSNFNVIADSTLNRDMDYTDYLTVNYLEKHEKAMTNQIVNSKYFNLSDQPTNDHFWKSLLNEGLKGYWFRTDEGYSFEDVPFMKEKSKVQRKSWAIYLKLDTIKNLIEYEYHQI